MRVGHNVARRATRSPLLWLALALSIGQLGLLYLILEARFSFTNLVDVPDAAAFDDASRATGPDASLRLALPAIDAAFEARVRGAIAARDAPDAALFSEVVRWTHEYLPPAIPGRRKAWGRDSPLPWQPWDTRALDEARAAGAGFLCSSYARTAAAAGQVLGLDTRVVWLDGHVVVEAYDRDRGGWIAADPTVAALVAVDGRRPGAVSWAQASELVREGREIAWDPVGPLHPDVDPEASLAFLHKVLRRDLLVYVDGETAVRRNTPAQLVAWLRGHTRGVRLAFPEAPARSWKRPAFALGCVGLLVVGVFGVRSGLRR